MSTPTDDKFIKYEQKLEKAAKKVIKKYQQGKQKAYTNASSIVASLDE